MEGLPATEKVYEGSINFPSVRKILSTSVNIPCGLETFRQLSSTFFAARRPSISSCLLPTTFCVDRRPSANCHQLSVRPNDLSTSVNFCTSGRTSVKFRQYLSTFRAARTPSVNFLCGREVCQSLSIIRAAGISSVNILCNRETFCHLLSTLLAAERPFINFFQFSVQSGDILSTSVNFPCVRKKFR